MPAKRPIRKPVITLAARRKRLLFCKAHETWTVEQWQKVMFSDESTFQVSHNVKKHVRRPEGSSALSPRYTIKTMKHPQSVMVWGCFSFQGRGALTFLNKGEHMNTDRYLSILQEKLSQFMEINQTEIFQQDSAPCHVSRKAKSWFVEHDVELLDWPGNSPDINPIENLWQMMKTKLYKRTYRNVEELKAEILSVWCKEVTLRECQRLVSSMPRRIKAVIKNRGYPTKY